MMNEKQVIYLRNRLVEQLNDLQQDYINRIIKSDNGIEDRYFYRIAEIRSGIRILNIILEKEDILNYDL